MAIFAFEGLDGVGKSTQADAIARQTGGVAVSRLMAGNSREWKQGRHTVNQGTNVESRFLYFLGLNRFYMLYARQYAEEGYVATLDSSVYRTVATHRVLGSKIAKEFAIEQIIAPHVAIHIELPESERQNRLMARDGGLIYSSHWDEILHDNADAVREEFESFGLPKVDGSLPIDQVTEQARQILRF